MEDVEKVFGNIKSLQSMASIEAIVASAGSIDNTFVQKIDVEKTSYEEILKPLFTDLLVTHQLFKLKLLLKDAEISALSDRIEDNGNGKSNLNDAGIPHINSLMNDIKLAVSNATNSTSENNSKITQEISLQDFTENTLSNEIKQFIELKLDEMVKENFYDIVDEVLQEKNEKQSKVLDLSGAYISQKNK